MQHESFSVKSYRGEYSVRFVEDAFLRLAEELREGDWLFVDANIARLYEKQLAPLAEKFPIKKVEAAEPSKSYDGVRPIILELIENGFKKNNRLVAIGGGITQDVTAFISSILYRGVDWIFVPTNLLSQCDSCIGSKTSINFADYKNQIGGFFPPALILIDTAFLDTLEDSEIRSGLGEMAQYFLVESEEAFARYESALDDALAMGPALKELIGESLAIKKRMIELDEFDEGPRNVFNYGHSFGHAIEGYTAYAVPHGIAVSYGMDLANEVSHAMGMIDRDMVDRVSGCLAKVRSKTPLPEIELDRYLGYLKKDKKNTSQGIRLILTKGYGKMFLTLVEPAEDFRRTVKACFERFQREHI
jgi:3-dehydroquinate synthase